MSVTNPVNYSSSSPVYLQVCSVCKGKFTRRNDWLKHLTLENHQKLARKECIDKWDNELRNCCLIIYTSKPLTNDTTEEIVSKFSREINGELVADFVWWEDRPHIAILQFESRGKAENICNATGCKNSLKVQIRDSQWVQAKNGADLLEFEWHAILPTINHPTLVTLPTKRTSDHLSENQVCLTDSQNVPAPRRKRMRTDSNNNGLVKTNKSTITNKLPLVNLESSINQPPPFPWTRKKHPLQFEYWTITKAINIPDHPDRPESLIEAQVSRLFDYLCQFDTRSHYLITLVTNWTTLNSINVHGKDEPENSVELPSHYTVKWLVIFFLCCKNYIPTPRQILDRNPDITVVKDGLTVTNIGFHYDPTFVEEWQLDKQNNPTFGKKRKNPEKAGFLLLHSWRQI